MMEERGIDYGFMMILIGSLITFFDFRINGLNLVPDFVGYIIITIGLSKAIQLDEKFKHAQLFAVVMIVLSLPDIIEFEGYNPLWPLSIIGTFVILCLTWYLLKGISDVASRNGNENLASLSEKVLYITIVIMVCGAGISSLVNILGPWAISLVFVAVPLAFIAVAVGLVELFVFYRASNELTSSTLVEPSSLQ